jgi:hypothetical protein
VPGFPHHTHEGSEENVQEGYPFNLLELLALIEAEI